MSDGAEAFPFSGRSGELAVLRRLIHNARQGTGQIAVVEGEPGSKTRLLIEIIAHAARSGFQFFRAALTNWLATAHPIPPRCAPSAPSGEPCLGYPSPCS